MMEREKESLQNYETPRITVIRLPNDVLTTSTDVGDEYYSAWG